MGFRRAQGVALHHLCRARGARLDRVPRPRSGRVGGSRSLGRRVIRLAGRNALFARRDDQLRHANVYLEDCWRMLGAIEAVNGLILFGLTTETLFSTPPFTRSRRCGAIDADGRDLDLRPVSTRLLGASGGFPSRRPPSRSGVTALRRLRAFHGRRPEGRCPP